jgi:hypothetical protein
MSQIIMPICPLCRKDNSFLLARLGERRYLSCRECQLVFLSPEQRLPLDVERERYLQHNNHPDDPEYRKFLDRLLTHLKPNLQEGEKGLDYGAGPGPTLSLMLEEQGFTMNIYDPFFAPDPASLDQVYDFITCTETVEHFFCPAEEFARFNSMLRPGGWLGIMTEMLKADQEFEKWWYHRDPTHVSFYRKETMRWIGRKYGWEAVFPGRNVTLFQKE